MTSAPDASARAVARLPGFDLTVEVFEPEGEGGQEELRMTLRLPPGANSFAPAIGLVNPMLSGLVMAQAIWGPWLNLWGAMAWPMLPGGTRQPPSRE